MAEGMGLGIRMRQRLERLLEHIAAFASLERLSIALLSVVLAVLSLSGAGKYLEIVGFLQPAFVLRDVLGFDVPLDARLRVVVVDDKSLDKLGRHPSFADWLAIGDHLAALGVRTGIFLGVPSLASEIGTLPQKPAALAIKAGAVETQGQAKSRSVPGEAVPARLTLAAPRLGPREGRRFLIPSESVLSHLAGLGALNFGDEMAMPTAFSAAADRVVPNLGLAAAQGLRVGPDGLFADAVGPLPLRVDGELIVDFKRTGDIMKLAIPVSTFFDEAKTGIAPELSPALREKLVGVEVVVFAREAHTGARFVSTPFGKQPSYTSIVAIVNSTLRHDFLGERIPTALALALLWLVGCAIAAFGKSRLGFVAGGSLFLLWVAGGFATFVWGREILPIAQGTILIATALACRGVRAWRDSVATTGRLAAEIETGQLVQTLMLRAPKTGTWGKWSFHIHFHPYGALSGDWFQVYVPERAPEGGACAVLAIGDVVGKGASASLLTSAIASIWAAHSRRWRNGASDVEPLIRELDETIKELFVGQQNSTLSLAVLTETQAFLIGCGAPAWQRLDFAEHVVHRVATRPAAPLGVDPEPIVPRLVACEPAPGQILMCHTDGVLDSGRSRVAFRTAFASGAADAAQGTDQFQAVVAAACAVSVGEALPDDVTILMISRAAA